MRIKLTIILLLITTNVIASDLFRLVPSISGFKNPVEKVVSKFFFDNKISYQQRNSLMPTINARVDKIYQENCVQFFDSVRDGEFGVSRLQIIRSMPNCKDYQYGKGIREIAAIGFGIYGNWLAGKIFDAVKESWDNHQRQPTPAPTPVRDPDLRPHVGRNERIVERIISNGVVVLPGNGTDTGASRMCGGVENEYTRI